MVTNGAILSGLPYFFAFDYQEVIKYLFQSCDNVKSVFIFVQQLTTKRHDSTRFKKRFNSRNKIKLIT